MVPMENEQLTLPLPNVGPAREGSALPFLLFLFSLAGSAAFLLVSLVDERPFPIASVFPSEPEARSVWPLLFPWLVALFFSSSSFGVFVIPLFVSFRSFQLSLCAYASFSLFQDELLPLLLRFLPSFLSWLSFFAIGESAVRSARRHLLLSINRSVERCTYNSFKYIFLSALMIAASLLCQQFAIPLLLPQ